jgi:arsenite methyltransferase
VKEQAPGKASRLASLASATSLLAVVSCYGTLGAVALLSVIGVTVHLNEVLMTRIITVVLAVALAGLAYSYRLHRHGGPLLLGLAAAALLLWVFYGRYSRPLEALGFVGLVAASVWDFRAKHHACRSATREGNPLCP